jgi:hypothetical protein
MTALTQRQAVLEHESQLWKVTPVLDVVCVQAASRGMSALLASVFVAALYGSGPLHVLPIARLQFVGTAAAPVAALIADVFSPERVTNGAAAFRGMARSQSPSLRHALGAVQSRDVLWGQAWIPVAAKDVSLRFTLADRCELPTTAPARKRSWALTFAHPNALMVAVDEAYGLSLDVAQSPISYLRERRQRPASALAKHVLFYTAGAAA